MSNEETVANLLIYMQQHKIINRNQADFISKEWLEGSIDNWVDDFLKESQVDLNFEAFQTILPTLSSDLLGKFALMRDMKVIDFFDTASDANSTASLIFPDNKFSIQEVVNDS